MTVSLLQFLLALLHSLAKYGKKKSTITNYTGVKLGNSHSGERVVSAPLLPRSSVDPLNAAEVLMHTLVWTAAVLQPLTSVFCCKSAGVKWSDRGKHHYKHLLLIVQMLIKGFFLLTTMQ
ncbi:hypothetical protein AMECASPLE_019209 [Ameca splendens]|uniref:Secreted protein n=1 Tax=Ameca splendens TaxID=208324 RepID=A0ABV0YEY1_9TELE